MEVVAFNSPTEIEARTWLNAHKAETGHTWTIISDLTSVAGPTLSAFSSGKYQGDNAKIATHVLAYRDRLAAQAEIAVDLPMVPSWYETPTSRKVTSLLGWAQSGKIVLIVTGPGIGKTRAAERFTAADPNVWLATMAPSTAGVATMASEVASVIGLGEVKGSPQQLSRQIRGRIAGRKGLLIVDEAQELTDKAINEIRGWHDRTGVGVALMGNEKVVGQIETRKSALAQISSRCSMKYAQAVPLPGDIDAALDAWGIRDSDQRAFLSKIGALPGALREMTNTIEIALIASFSDDRQLSLADLRDAARQRNVKVGGL